MDQESEPAMLAPLGGSDTTIEGDCVSSGAWYKVEITDEMKHSRDVRQLYNASARAH